MKYLWENPKLISIIIQNTPIEEVRDNLADFFTNNFYENILSKNGVQNNLLFLIFLLLKEEINELVNYDKPEIFLNDTRCGYILGQLFFKKDIQIYFKTIIYDAIDKVKHLNEELSFNPENIPEEKNIKKNVINEQQKKLFKEKLINDLKKEDLDIFLSEYEKKNSKNEMKDYINSINNDMKFSPGCYNTKMLKEAGDKFLNIYEEYIFIVSQIIDTILNSILKNINLIPYSLKCISKIISQLIQKKFKGLKNFQINAFISKFFFYQLYSQYFLNPEYVAYICDCMFSKMQQNNLIIIMDFIKKFSLGKLYKDNNVEGNFTAFNWIFIEKMPILINIFENLVDVKLPNFIENIIEGKADDKYIYNFLEENTIEIIYHNAMCFNTENILSIVNNIENCKDELFKNNLSKELKATIEALLSKSNINQINDFKNKIEYKPIKEDEGIINTSIFMKNLENRNDKSKNKKILKSFLILDFKCQNDVKNLFYLNQKKIPLNISNSNFENNSVKKVKKFLYEILDNYFELNRDDFNESSLANSKNIFSEIKKNMKSLNISIDNKIRADWYIDALLKELEKLPNELTTNDYRELYAQLEKDLKESIQILNIEYLGLFMDKAKFVKKQSLYYDNSYNILKIIDIDSGIINLSKGFLVPVEIRYSKNKNNLDINPNPTIINAKVQETLVKVDKNKNKIIICKTIDDFINNFPDISLELDVQKTNAFMILKQVNFGAQMDMYIKYINAMIIKDKIVINDSKLNLIMAKIYDYIMESIYDKIFPKEIEPLDNMIYLNCKKISWVEPKHFVKDNKENKFDNFVNDVTEYIEKLHEQKCPRKKMYFIDEIFQSIYNLNFFLEKESEGIDGEVPLLNYALVKAKPKRIYSNCEYLKLFIGGKNKSKDDNFIAQISHISMQIAKITSSSLFNITDNEYQENCKRNILNEMNNIK